MAEITITHKIEVDKCIEKEILKLNNEQNILTLHSCCGHDKGEYGFIAVHPENIKNMLELGYERYGKYSTQPNENEKEYELPTFKPKSKCKGRCY